MQDIRDSMLMLKFRYYFMPEFSQDLKAVFESCVTDSKQKIIAVDLIK